MNWSTYRKIINNIFANFRVYAGKKVRWTEKDRNTELNEMEKKVRTPLKQKC